MSSSPPTALGKYQIIREIARSNDIVYEGYDPQMTRRVAIKELNMPGGATPQQADDRIQRFKREAQAAGRLNHPNIMTVYDVEEDGGRLFMAMEYLDGQTLRAEIDGHGKLAPERAVDIARAVLAGLAHAHEQGVVHRDIKPDNVQILSNGAIKITDFGIARLTFQPNLTMDGQVFGTPSYMSPEQVVGKEIDPRSDLFSVGVMLYEMLAGVKPFAGDSVVAITYAIMNREPEPLPDGVPYALGEAVRRSLEKTPHLRFDNSNDMADALQDALRPAPPPPAYDPVPSTPAPQAYNPYAAPSPYGQMAAPPVVNAPYNPYGAPAPAPVPASYGYNPYSQAPYGGPGPTMAPPNGPPPIYYPPPPRQPLLKPETSAFLKKLIVTFVVFGTFFALILVGVWALFTQFGRIQATRTGKPIVESISRIPTNIPLEDQIQQALEAKSKLPPGADTSAADRMLSDKYVLLAKKNLEGSTTDFGRAEQAFASAEAIDPHNPSLLLEYGAFFQKQAEVMIQGSPERAERYRMASEKFLAARNQESDRDQQAKDGLYGADAAYRSAYNAQLSGDRNSMRAAYIQLQEARAYVGNNDDLRGKIEAILGQLR